MRKIYFDCTYGINGFMALNALRQLGVPSQLLEEEDVKIRNSIHELAHCNGEQHQHGHENQSAGDEHHEYSCGAMEHHHEYEHAAHGRSYEYVKEIIESAALPQRTLKYALAIYETIALAEARVHKATLETVHFHEVGRDEAICNIVKTAFCVDYLDIDEVYCGILHDGTGFVECSHGLLPLPVPAVAAMLEDSGLVYESEDVRRELVTPSGLAILVGLRAIYSEGMPSGTVLETSFAQLHDAAPGQGMTAFLLD